jgi:glycosyltransferase involved in cell wall biosynthesis
MTLRVCFVVDSLPEPALGGGAELQCYLIARGLVARGWDVVYITRTEATQSPKMETGFKICRADPCLRGESWIARYSRGLTIFRILGREDPDIVFFTNPGSEAGCVVLSSLVYRKKTVYRAASSMDADLTFGEGGWNEFGLMARNLHRFAVTSADVIVANAAYVASRFSKYLPGKNIRVIPNGLEIDEGNITEDAKHEPSHVLWIARMEKWKNPEAFVRLAEKLPEIRFVMCGSGSLYESVAEQASRAPNLTLTGGVDGEAKASLFRKAIALVNTSYVEGFPNTLIEAGIRRLPYISFVDPDEVICRYKLGFHPKSFSELVEMTSSVAKDKQIRSQMGARIRRYVEKNHDIRDTVSEYDRLLRSLLRPRENSTTDAGDNDRRCPARE